MSWVLSAWATQPYYTLVVSFLFAPYFANVVVGDPVYGQAVWGYASAAAGVLIAVGSPLLGALADGYGARKPWIALFSASLLPGSLVFGWPCLTHLRLSSPRSFSASWQQQRPRLSYGYSRMR